MIYVKTLKPWTLNLPLRKGLGQGVLTGIIASILFAIFVFIYTNLLDPEFMQSIIENEPFGSYLNPYIAAVAVAIEGIASRFNPYVYCNELYGYYRGYVVLSPSE